MSLFQTSLEEIESEAEPRVVSMADEEAADLLQALSSETARGIWQRLKDEPATPTVVASDVETSLQNAHYRLHRLESAGAVEIVGTTYSEKGREMDVYAPSAEPLVFVSEDDADEIRDLLSRALGALAGLALVSVAVQQAVPKPTAPSQVGDAAYASNAIPATLAAVPAMSGNPTTNAATNESESVAFPTRATSSANSPTPSSLLPIRPAEPYHSRYRRTISSSPNARQTGTRTATNPYTSLRVTNSGPATQAAPPAVAYSP